MMDHRIVITQGEHAIESRPDACITTLLGSCVACCLWDPVAGVGGMNHMLLAGSAISCGTSSLQGINEMELLVNGLLKRGARRSRLLAKAFGGASMVQGLSDIGAANCLFTLDYLEREKIECISHSLGGNRARQLMFWPATGRVRQKLVDAETEPVNSKPVPQRAGNDIELL